MTGKLNGKTALVTAAASGIGEATAETFAKEGAKLTLSDINAERGEAVARRLRDAGAAAQFIEADCTQESEIESIVRKTTQAYGALDVAANVVGGACEDSAWSDLHTKSVSGWDGTLAFSLRSTFLCLKHEIAYMLDHGGGSIVNVASLAGMLYVPEAGPAYSAAKAGVISLTRFAAVTYGDRGIRVNCISPGVTLTNGLVDAVGPEQAKKMAERMVEGHVIKRTIEAREQAAAILWLASEDAAMVTGQVIPVDGGWTAR